MRIRDEELVQFLLGDADLVLRQRVEAALATDARLSKRLDELRAALGLLDSLKLSPNPPDDLVARTLMRIDADIDVDSGEASRDGDSGVQSESELPWKNRLAASGAESAVPVHARRPSNTLAATATRTHRQFWDSAILSLSIVAICCLMLPLMLEARSQSRRLQCAYNLNSLGRGLTALAMADGDRRFPSVPPSGPEAFAGIVAVRLNDAHLLDSPALLKCASLSQPSDDAACVLRIPSREELFQAGAEQRKLWRTSVGGNYAYNLGVVDGGRLIGPRLEGRTHFAILADAPRIDNDQEAFVAHEGRGVNIYYEDGHIAFVPVPRVKQFERPFLDQPRSDRSSAGNLRDKRIGSTVLPIEPWSDSSDDPFRNIDGQHAYGLHPNDAVLGPSYSSPLPRTVNLP